MREGVSLKKQQTILAIFKNVEQRNKALIKAFTEEKQKLYDACDPEEEAMCLYGDEDGTWRVDKPAARVPPEIPEPALGINFDKDSLEWRLEWAVHCDTWVYTVALFYGMLLNFDKEDRKELFQMINDLPTVSDIVRAEKPQTQSVTSSSNQGQSSDKAVPQKHQHTQQKLATVSEAEDEDQDGDEDKDQDGDKDQDVKDICDECGEAYSRSKLWILCETCNSWIHGKCANITRAQAESIGKYECLSCSGY